MVTNAFEKAQSDEKLIVSHWPNKRSEHIAVIWPTIKTRAVLRLVWPFDGILEYKMTN